jgi:hypothetical protein
MGQLRIVYVLTNPAMPGLIKIGKTDREDANIRIAELYTTGVPVPFKLEFACKVPNPDEVERALHIAFGPARVNPKREFFRMDPEQAIAILRLLHTEDATVEVEHQPSFVDRESLEAAEILSSRRPVMNFTEMGIPLGEMLYSIHDETAVMVSTPRKVKLGDEELSLTAVTRHVLKIEHSVQPGPHWTYKGRRLSELYEDTYGDS